MQVVETRDQMAGPFPNFCCILIPVIDLVCTYAIKYYDIAMVLLRSSIFEISKLCQKGLRRPGLAMWNLPLELVLARASFCPCTSRLLHNSRCVWGHFDLDSYSFVLA